MRAAAVLNPQVVRLWQVKVQVLSCKVKNEEAAVMITLYPFSSTFGLPDPAPFVKMAYFLRSLVA